MAIVEFGPIVVGVRGTISGVTYSANSSGPFVKGWRKPINPRTPRQLVEQARIAGMPNVWRSLTQPQRDAWDVWAALPAQELFNSLGQSYFASGFNWFVKINIWGTSIGFTITPTPPTLPKPGPPTILTLSVRNTPLTATVTYAAGTFGATDSIVVFATPWPSQAALTPPANFRLMAGAFNPPPTAFTFQTQWNNILGAPIVSNKAFVRVYNQNGQRFRSTATLITSNIVD